MKPQNSRLRGFTLTELLFITAALVVLAAVSFPVFVRAQQPQNNLQQRDPNMHCMSNLKQVGLGIMQYVQDYDEKFPVLEYRDARTRKNITWRSNVMPYVKNASIFRCPLNPFGVYPASADTFYNSTPQTYLELRPDVAARFDENGTQVNEITDYVQVPNGFISTSYAANPAVMQHGEHSLIMGDNEQTYYVQNPDGSRTETKTYVPGEKLNNPASLIMVGETVRGDAAINFNAPLASFSQGEILFAGHQAKMGCLFADGHVAMKRPSETTALWFNTPQSHKDYDLLGRRLEAAELAFTPQLEENEPVSGENKAITENKTEESPKVAEPKTP